MTARIIPYGSSSLFFNFFLLPDIFWISNENSERFSKSFLTTDGHYKPLNHKPYRRLPRMSPGRICETIREACQDFELTQLSKGNELHNKLTSELVSLCAYDTTRLTVNQIYYNSGNIFQSSISKRKSVRKFSTVTGNTKSKRFCKSTNKHWTLWVHDSSYFVFTPEEYTVSNRRH